MADRARTGALHGIRPSGALVGVVPFFAYATVFLIIPTLVVVVGAFLSGGRPTLGNVRALDRARRRSRPLQHSIILSAVTAVAGAVIGGLLAYAVSTAHADGVLKRFVTSLCGVLAQFGGVALAFAFLASFGATGFLTTWLARVGSRRRARAVALRVGQGPDAGLPLLPDPAHAHRLPARGRGSAAAVARGHRDPRRQHLGLLAQGGRPDPAARPSSGAVLLLFTNAFSAYATAAALVSQGSPLLPLAIGNTLTSEVILGQENIGKAMALAMVVVVAVAMTLYAVLDRRASKWLAP